MFLSAKYKLQSPSITPHRLTGFRFQFDNQTPVDIRFLVLVLVLTLLDCGQRRYSSKIWVGQAFDKVLEKVHSPDDIWDVADTVKVACSAVFITCRFLVGLLVPVVFGWGIGSYFEVIVLRFAWVECASSCRSLFQNLLGFFVGNAVPYNIFQAKVGAHTYPQHRNHGRSPTFGS